MKDYVLPARYSFGEQEAYLIRVKVEITFFDYFVMGSLSFLNSCRCKFDDLTMSFALDGFSLISFFA